MPDSSPPTLYFAYGSNLWREQMARRCPTSKFLGTGCLHNYSWLINQRGYANIAEIARGVASNGELDPHTTEVWGLVYSLEPEDERNLDINEGVPFAYEKECLTVDFWPADSEKPSTMSKPGRVPMLVYINRDLIEPNKSKDEYVHRMNMGIADALQQGVPPAYVQNVLRKFIPNEEQDGLVVTLAEKQAQNFEEE